MVHSNSETLPVPLPATAARLLVVAATAAERGIRGAIATVIARHGSAPGTPGQKLYLGADGTCLGTVGGGALEKVTLEKLVTSNSEANPTHALVTIKLGAEIGMCCGGRLEVMIEPIEAVVPCLIVGGGHVASALAPLLARVGYAVTVVDARDAWGESAAQDGVVRVTGDFDDIGKGIDASGVCLVMTHDHSVDQDAIEWALGRKFAFVGGVGSRAKAERSRQRLEAKGFSEADRARVRMPLGVDIHARSPDEIAIAVAAEMIAWRKRR